jgi:hypothetical protein
VLFENKIRRNEIMNIMHQIGVNVMGLSNDKIKRDVYITGSYTNLFSRMMRVSDRSSKAGQKAGLIGVGVISYAEARRKEFLRKIRAKQIAKLVPPITPQEALRQLKKEKLSGCVDPTISFGNWVFSLSNTTMAPEWAEFPCAELFDENLNPISEWYPTGLPGEPLSKKDFWVKF